LSSGDQALSSGRQLRSFDVNPRVVLALSLVCVFALGALVLVARGHDDEAPAEPAGSEFEGAIMPAGLRAPDFRLRDQDGERIAMRDLRGKPVIVSFLYTTCRDTCPLQAQTVKGALDDLGHDVPAIAIAVDPPRDTPDRARVFLSKQRMIGRMDFVLGSREQLRPLWKGFAIQPQSAKQEHLARFTLVDKRGFQRVGFPVSQATPERLAHDVAVLERERRG
jgi:protein SCO1